MIPVLETFNDDKYPSLCSVEAFSCFGREPVRAVGRSGRREDGEEGESPPAAAREVALIGGSSSWGS